jgi:hypothetical protein
MEQWHFGFRSIDKVGLKKKIRINKHVENSSEHWCNFASKIKIKDV